MSRRAIGLLAALALTAGFVLLVLRPSQDQTLANEPNSTVQTRDTAQAADQSSAADQRPSSAPDPTPAPISGPDNSRSSLSIGMPPDGALLVEVVRLADGDSFDIRWIDPRPAGVRRDEVRLLGVNAPEGNACFGPEARAVLDGIVGDTPVLVAIAPDEHDDFGRVIADVWTPDGVLINVAVVEQGAALALSGSGPHADLLADAQALAKSERRGLWSACGGEAEVVITDLWADAPGRDDQNPNGEWIDITNVGSEPVDLSGWGIRDESTRHRFTCPDGFTLDPGQTVRIGSGCDDDPDSDRVDLWWCDDDPVWNNGGDTAYLVDADGRFVDEWGYRG